MFEMATYLFNSFQELQQLKTDLEQVLALTQDLINAQLGASAGSCVECYYQHNNGNIYWGDLPWIDFNHNNYGFLALNMSRMCSLLSSFISFWSKRGGG